MGLENWASRNTYRAGGVLQDVMADSATLASQNRGPTVLAVVIALLALSTAFLALRLVSRFGVVKRVGSDDYAIILAWVRSLRFCRNGNTTG